MKIHAIIHVFVRIRVHFLNIEIFISKEDNKRSVERSNFLETELVRFP